MSLISLPQSAIWRYVLYGICALTCIVIVFGLWLKRQMRRMEFKFADGKRVPGFQPTLPWGTIGQVRALIDHRDDIFHIAFEKMFAKWNSPYVQMNGMMNQHLLVRRWEDCKQALTDKAFNGRLGTPIAMHIFKDNGIVFNGNMESWRAHRAVALRGLMKPAYLRNVCEGPMVSTVRELFQYWKNTMPMDTTSPTPRFKVEVVESVALLTLEVIGHAALSVKFGCLGTAQTDEMKALNQAIVSVLDWLAAYSSKPPFWLVYPDARFRKHQQAYEFVSDFVLKLIAQRRAEGIDQHGDFMDLILQGAADPDVEKRHFEDMDVKHTVADLIGAGQDTTGHTVCWTLYFLATHPEVQQQIYDEVSKEFGDNDPTIDNLKALRYTEGALREALRLRPTVPVIPRQAIETTSIGGIRLRKGSVVWIVVWSLGRDPEIYPDPLSFKPERWFDESTKVPFNFGFGGRQCIGERFAINEAKIILSMIMRRYQVRLAMPEEEVGMHASVTMKPHPKLDLWFYPRA